MALLCLLVVCGRARRKTRLHDSRQELAERVSSFKMTKSQTAGENANTARALKRLFLFSFTALHALCVGITANVLFAFKISCCCERALRQRITAVGSDLC